MHSGGDEAEREAGEHSREPLLNRGRGTFNRSKMSQRKLTRQLRLWEGPEGPPQAPFLASPVSPVDHPRGQGGSSLFRRMKLNRSIQECRRSCHCVCRYKFLLLRCTFLPHAHPPGLDWGVRRLENCLCVLITHSGRKIKSD